MHKKMVDEALKRLKLLQGMGLWDEVTKAWKKNNKACLSEAKMIFELCGVNFTFDERPEFKSIKEKFEVDYGCTVYYGIYSNTNCGRHLALLFISPDEEEWESDQSDLKEGYPFAYV